MADDSGITSGNGAGNRDGTGTGTGRGPGQSFGSPPPPTPASARPLPAPLPPAYDTPAPPKKTNWGKWLLILAVIVGVLLLAIAACVFAFVGAVSAPVDRSNDFLAEIDAENWSDAMARTDPNCSTLSEERLRQAFGNAALRYNLNSSSVTNNDATVTGTLGFDNDPADTITMTLRRSNGEWRVCSLQLSS